MTPQPTYEQAIQRLESIAAALENDQLDLSQLAETLREARQLAKHCQDQLLKAETEINEILNSDGTR